MSIGRRVHALVVLLVSACTPAPPAQRRAPPASTTDSPPPTGTAAASPEECERLARGLHGVADVAGVAALRADTPEPQIEGMMQRLDALSSSLEKLRDALTSPTLAIEANRLMMATAYLLHEVAGLDALRRTKGPAGLEPFERSIDVGFRQLELARRSARAHCEAAGSRGQSAEWKAAFSAAFQALVEPMRPCLREEARRFPDRRVGRIALRVHVGPDGRVTLAGPTDLTPSSSYSAELVHCVVGIIDRTMFPRPAGEAIVDVPLGE